MTNEAKEESRNDGNGRGSSHQIVANWELVWLNSIVVSWGSPRFAEFVSSPHKTKTCLAAVLDAIEEGEVKQFIDDLNRTDASAAWNLIKSRAEHAHTSAEHLFPPWLEVRVQLAQNDEGWGGEGWNLPRTRIEVVLMPFDAGSPPGQQRVERLVELMTMVRGSWLFSGLRTSGDGVEAQQMDATAASPPARLQTIARGGTESPLAAFEQTQRWFYVWSKVLATADTSEGFRERLIRDGELVLCNDFGYEVPRGASVCFRESSNDDSSETLVAVTMILPPAPEMTDRPIALAEYAELGRTHPFTMCC